MNVLNLLKQDHKKVNSLLKQLAKKSERASTVRAKLFKQIKLELDLHKELEETLFYPLLKEHKVTRSLAFESYEEHAIVTHLLEQLADETPNTETWTAKFTVLKENVEHHVKEEETELFPKVKKVIPNDKLISIGKEMMEIKKQKTNKED